MEERQTTAVLQEFPQLQRLAMFSPANQGFIADYLAHLRARHYTLAFTSPEGMQLSQSVSSRHVKQASRPPMRPCGATGAAPGAVA
jgi:hypothetical protein